MSDDTFDAMLSMNDPDFARKLADALGVSLDETIEIVTPQFERESRIAPALPDAWGRLTTLSASTLRAIGCRPWEEPDENGTVLMLFPWEWYSHIPEGFEVEDIDGEAIRFRRGKTDSDKRFGVLAYGIRVTEEPPA